MRRRVCSDYETQAEAQRAADTRDADGDGVYCEDLPCPCAGPSGGGEDRPAKPEDPAPRPRTTTPAVESLI